MSRISNRQHGFLLRIISKIMEPETFTFRDVETLEEFLLILQDDTHWYNKITRLAHESYFIAVKIPQYKYCRFGGLVYNPGTEPTDLELWNYTNPDYKIKMESLLHFRLTEHNFPDIITKLNQVIPRFRRRFNQVNRTVFINPSNEEYRRVVQEHRDRELAERIRVREMVGFVNQDLQQAEEVQAEPRPFLIITLNQDLVLPLDTQCTICMENLVQGKTNCEHFFCLSCIETCCHRYNHSSCPMCRTELTNFFVRRS